MLGKLYNHVNPLGGAPILHNWSYKKPEVYCMTHADFYNLGFLFRLLCKYDNNSWISYHSKPNIRLLESGSIICPITCHSNHLPLVCHSAVNDACQMYIQENVQKNALVDEVKMYCINLCVVS